MKYKLLSIKGQGGVNIGDYIQALASSQFLPQIDGFIDRERLKDYNSEECKLIMNGWYIHNAQQWPPSSKIIPLYVAVHFNSTVKDKLLSNESIAYLKQYEPIGCRDTNTVKLLQSKGVNAYFSGCMTLTLGRNYHSEIKENKYYFVDPCFVTHWNLYTTFYNAIYLLFHWRPICIIAKKHPDPKKGLRKKMIMTAFYREYKRFFRKEILINAEYINQQSIEYIRKFSTDEELLKEAERLVKCYAKAKLVVTSRIHCALPCLGLGTPVIYTEDAHQSEASACRFGGLRELFNILKWNNGHLVKEFGGKIPLDDTSSWSNKATWKELAERLATQCTRFCK